MDNLLDARLEAVFATVFGVTPIDDSTSMETVADWDSASHITLIVELENEFAIALTTDEVVQMTNVRSIKQVLSRKQLNAAAAFSG